MIIIERFFIKSLSFIAIFFFSISFIFYSLQTFLRIFFNQSLIWIDPLSSYLFVLSALYGSALAILKDENIKIEVFKKINQNSKIIFLKQAMASLATLFLGIIFFFHLQQEFPRPDVDFLNIPKWSLDVPYLFFILASFFFYLNRATQQFTSWIKKN